MFILFTSGKQEEGIEHSYYLKVLKQKIKKDLPIRTDVRIKLSIKIMRIILNDLNFIFFELILKKIQTYLPKIHIIN